MIAVLLAFLGANLCSALLARHSAPNAAPGWFAALCRTGQDAEGGCDVVLNSRWASLPPSRTVAPNWRVQFPVAGIGLAYFTLLMIWFIGVGRPHSNGRRWHLLPLVVGAAGLAASIAYLGVMAWVVDAWCPVCLTVHVLNALLFVVILLLRPDRSPTVARVNGSHHTPAPPPAISVHPTLRHAVVTLALAGAVIGILNQSSATVRWKDQSRRLEQMLIEIRDSSAALPAMWAAEPIREIMIRPDDPTLHSGPDAPVLVVWSDFQCSKCRAFADALRDRHLSAFGNRLTVVFKHFPLSHDCNPFVEHALHPRACDAARLAEAVRILAGNGAFRKVHDALFAGQDDPQSYAVESIAVLAGVDADALTETMRSEVAARRIRADMDQGHALSITGTPAAFLNGRRVPTLALVSDAFWEAAGRDARDRDAP